MRKKVTIGIVGMIFCGALLGCGDPIHKEGKEFNDKIVRASEEVEQPFLMFMEQLQSAIEGDRAALAELKKATTELQEALPTVKREVEQMKVPAKQSAKDFHAAELKSLANFEKIANDLDEIVQILEDKTLKTEQKASKVQPIEERVNSAHENDTNALQAAQAVFAKEYHIKLE